MPEKKKSIQDIKIPTYDDLFKTEEQRQDDKLERIYEIPLEEIRPFKNHPYGIRLESPDMIDLIDSIGRLGYNFENAVVRPHPDGQGYEMITGHRRQKALEINGISTIKAVVRNLTDDEATIYMVDSNIKREDVLPSEKGFAYKMKLEAMKHQGKRVDLTCVQVGHKLKGKKSVEILADETGESHNQVKRYIRLTFLIKPLRDMVDGIRENGKKIGLNPAVELSYLSEEHQQCIIKHIDDLDLTPSHAQAIRMKKLSQENRLDDNVIYSIMTEEKANQKEKLTFKMDEINQYFPKSYTPRQKQETVLKLLQQWSKKMEKKHER
ncbi:ParB/RepB/Spo0J family partition protein [[Eubacterium] hominis]|uniref:ParB/RepB/Spo0J family partition protein n=1 Tax=[Eubacterium] hominis TaxID=2764325 RepID=UPI003A4DFAE2